MHAHTGKEGKEGEKNCCEDTGTRGESIMRHELKDFQVSGKNAILQQYAGLYKF